MYAKCLRAPRVWYCTLWTVTYTKDLGIRLIILFHLPTTCVSIGPPSQVSPNVTRVPRKHRRSPSLRLARHGQHASICSRSLDASFWAVSAEISDLQTIVASRTTSQLRKIWFSWWLTRCLSVNTRVSLTLDWAFFSCVTAGLFPGRKNVSRVTFLYGFKCTHDGLNLGFKLCIGSKIHVILKFILRSVLQFVHAKSPMRPPVWWTTRKRRSNRRAHLFKLTASA